VVARRLGSAPAIIDGPAGPHVHWSGGGTPKVLIVGHHDTVFPVGSCAARPFAVVDGRAMGPGVFDMKAGIVQALHAVASLADRSGVELLITSDEEVGSLTSRDLIEARAIACGSVLVCEPSADGGALKIARKGTGTFEVVVHGKASHAGLEPEKGVNALVAAAELITHIATFGDLSTATTVTPTVAVAGTVDNVVPAEARVKVDVRVEQPGEKERLEGLFASLVTGNPVIVKAHPTVILPLAISVAVARAVLSEAGFDPNLVSLLIDDPAAPVAKEVAMNPEVRLIDYTGGPAFGNWLEANCRHAMVYTEKAGVNCIVVDSIDDYKAMLKNLAFTLSLYSGQMCTTPQTIFVSREGVKTPEGVISVEQFGRDLASAVSKFLDDPARAVEVLGAIQSPATLARLEAAHGLGEVLRASSPIAHPQWPEARVRSPLILRVAAADERAYTEERFGPITLVVETANTAESLARAERVIREQGAITFALYSTDPATVEQAEEAALRAGVALSIGLTGAVFVNQSAGFSDFHATGANPAANACLTDSAFVASRFFVVQSRRHVQ